MVLECSLYRYVQYGNIKEENIHVSSYIPVIFPQIFVVEKSKSFDQKTGKIINRTTLGASVRLTKQRWSPCCLFPACFNTYDTRTSQIPQQEARNVCACLVVSDPNRFASRHLPTHHLNRHRRRLAHKTFISAQPCAGRNVCVNKSLSLWFTPKILQSHQLRKITYFLTFCLCAVKQSQKTHQVE